MLVDPEKIDYFKWQIPDGSRVRLTLLREDDLKFIQFIHQLLDGVLHDQLLFSLLAEEWGEH